MLCNIIFWVVLCVFFFFFKQKTAYEMRISDWSSDVCSSDLGNKRKGRAMRIGIRELICIVVVLAIPPVFWWSIYRKMDEQVTRMNAEYEAKKEIGRASCRERVCQYV